MDLGLSLGDSAKQFFSMPKITHKGLDFNIRLAVAQEAHEGGGDKTEDERRRSLELFPLLPVSSTRVYSTPTDQTGNSDGDFASTRGLDVNKVPCGRDGEEEAALSSPNSTVSSFHMDFNNMYGGNIREAMEAMHHDGEAEKTSSRASDEDENGLTRKKLRLSKEQSVFLEESFKEHNTLNPKQKLALAKQLSLSARQVEVWFQNRRARTKLKQTEVDCEYLKKCCETLTEENRRLHKELQELRALKTSHPFYMQLPATTLTMCPSCERIASTADHNSNNNANNPNKATTTHPPGSLSAGFSLLGNNNNKPRF